MSLLNHLQAALEQVYDLSIPHRVETFLLSDRRQVGSLLGQTADTLAPELLLVNQRGADLSVSLYLSQETVQHLRRNDPRQTLHNGNLQAFWLAVEGVSHFLCLVWCAMHGRSVSQLELELQAEIDKYVIGVRLLHKQNGYGSQRPLHRLLFERFRIRSGLSPEQRARYLAASRCAGRYCRRLGGWGHDCSEARLLSELRRFYRMSRRDKFHHIG